MDGDGVRALLESNKNQRGIDNWNQQELGPDRLESFGIGLTELRKLAKKIGRDHELAAELWSGASYDERVVALLIDEPKKVSREQAERQVGELEVGGMLPHVFSSCDATLAKTPFVVDLAVEWVGSADSVRRRCGYGLLYEISKDKRKSAPDDAFFLARIERIRAEQEGETRHVRMAMAGALMGIGKRNKVLNAAALVAAREMAPVPGAPGCEPFDVTKHLTSDYLRKKLEL